MRVNGVYLPYNARSALLVVTPANAPIESTKEDDDDDDDDINDEDDD
jgi:hypothetical protein